MICTLIIQTPLILLNWQVYLLDFLEYIKAFAPTANVTQVSFRNGRATYTKLKD